jgi:putative transposase
MPRVARKKGVSGIYHVMMKGANGQELFHEEDDCVKFLDIFCRYKRKSGLDVYAWCLMNNHVHLLFKEGNEELSNTMKRIGVSFANYYHAKYQSKGHLFQDRFKSENVEENRYLFTVIRYIHQNPMKAGITKRVDEWRWSSYLSYYDKKTNPKNLLDEESVLQMISPDLAIAKESFKEFNERNNQDDCLDDCDKKRRLPDDMARLEIKNLLGSLEIAQVKSLPRVQRNELLHQIKKLEGISLRQAARILGVSINLIFRA